MLTPKSYPSLNTFYSQAYLKAQLALPPQQRPAVIQGEKNLQTNLDALAAIDPPTAAIIQAANWPKDLLLVQYWEGLCLFSVTQGKVFTLEPDVEEQLTPLFGKREHSAFRSPPAYPALCYLLAHPYQGIHGMARAHYLVEDNPEYVKAFLHLRHFAERVRRRELIIFTGGQTRQNWEEHFQTLRYVPPLTHLDSTGKLAGVIADTHKLFIIETVQQQVQEYYASAEFRRRREDIIAGRLQPRILIETSRWTTFLQYSSADFQRAFEALGCETRLIKEENDAQTLTLPFRLQTLADFQPDALFLVSHARPTVPFYPRQLSIISHIQDKCGPLLGYNDLRDHITNTDMLACVSREHQRFILHKNVPLNQTLIMPIPADEKHFYPLPADHPLAGRFSADISFVKHADGEKQQVFEQFLAHHLPPAQPHLHKALV